MVLLFASGMTALNAQCVVAGTDFDTSKDLCCPIMTSDEDGWYDGNLDWNKLCKTDMFIGPEYVKQIGIGGFFSGQSSNDMKKIDDVFHLTNAQQTGGKQYGYSIVTAQPKLIHSFCKANDTPNNMYVNIGSASNCAFVSYTVNGLIPGSSVELSFTLYNLLDFTYFEHITTNLGSTSSYITQYSYQNGKIKENSNNVALQLAVVSSDDVLEFNTGYNNAINLNKTTNATRATADYGASTKVTHSAKASADGSITFYFLRTNESFQIPSGIYDIKVTGEFQPSITHTGNPCPEQPLRIFTRQTYPEGTTYLWKESPSGQTSTDLNFNFIPGSTGTQHKITCEVAIPGCNPILSSPLTIESGDCCTDENGAPMAMTNLYYDDFGDFPSDDKYVWTDKYGI
ncbi:MAG: hypothetical protein IKZ67_00615, partial [Paludibacteraceae bacterium]|nr:hypothetical protein [Paludibacteraceae bacterium]